MVRAKVIATITTEFDLETMTPTHAVGVEDCDGLSEISSEVLGALVIGGLQSAERAARERFPRAGQAAERADAEAGEQS